MKGFFSKRGVVPVVVVMALIAGIAIGAAFFARSAQDDGDSAAPVSEASSTTTAAPPASAAEGSSDPVTGGANGGRTDGGAEGIPPDAAAADGLVLVEPSSGNGYAFSDDDRGFEATGTLPPPDLPVDVRISSTTDLADGQAIRISVTPKPDANSQIFGFEARICQQDAQFTNLSDFQPPISGKCIDAPLSGGSDDYLRVDIDPPYQLAEGTIRAGVGTHSYTTEYDTGVSITCDRDNPCQLVLLLQVPYGYGFKTYPMTFR